MRERLKNIYRTVEKLYREAYNELAISAEELYEERSLEELADTTYALREAGELINRLRIRVEALKTEIEAKACTIAVESGEIDPIRTEYCTATPDMKISVSVPKRRKEPEAYAELMTALGVPRELWDRGVENSPAVDLHYPGLVEMVTERAAAGLPLPPGVSPDRTKTMFRLAIRRRRGILGE